MFFLLTVLSGEIPAEKVSLREAELVLSCEDGHAVPGTLAERERRHGGAQGAETGEIQSELAYFWVADLK